MVIGGRDGLIILVLALALAPAWPEVPDPEAGDYRELIRDGRSALAEHRADQALNLYLEALEKAEAKDDYLAVAVLHNLIGEVHEGAERYQMALSHYESALRVLASGSPAGEADKVSEALKRLRAQGKEYNPGTGPPVATDLYRGNLGDPNAVFDHSRTPETLQALSLLNTANMYLRQNQFSQADGLYQRALEVVGPEQRLLGRKLYANLAWSALKQRDFARAAERLDAALAGLPAAVPPVELRRALLAVGVQLREQRRFAEALDRLQQATALYREADDVSGYCRALAHLGTGYLLAGQPARAGMSYSTALNQEPCRQDREIRWHAQGGLARAYHATGELEQAVEYYRNYLDTVEQLGGGFTTDQGKVSFLEDHDRIFQDYIRAAAGLAEQRQDFSLVRQAVERIRERTLEDLQLSRRDRPPAPAGRLPVKYVFGESDDLDLYQYGDDTVNMAAQMAPGVASGPISGEDDDLDPAGSMGQVRPAAIAPVTFLEYYILPEQLIILVKTVDGKIAGAVVPLEKPLEEPIADYRHALGVAGQRGVAWVGVAAAGAAPEAGLSRTALGRSLYRQLIEPVSHYLPGDAPLVIVPHGPLWLLPFAALQDPDDVYFNDRHVLTYAASEATWRLTAGRPRLAYRAVRAWVAGDPRMPSQIEACGGTFSLQPLPGAREEAEAIAALLGPEKALLFTGEQADRLRLEAWHSDFTVLHLATHGVACAEEPLDSFIVLAALKSGDVTLDTGSGRLSMRHDPRLPVTLTGPGDRADYADRLQADGFTYPGLLQARTIVDRFGLRADLVALSACQTGLGRVLGQGNIGFSRTLLAAGARSLLVSLWRVSDQATRELMIAFYREYLRHGNKGLALQQAMRHTRKIYPRPRDWAAFTLVGLFE